MWINIISVISVVELYVFSEGQFALVCERSLCPFSLRMNLRITNYCRCVRFGWTA